MDRNDTETRRQQEICDGLERELEALALRRNELNQALKMDLKGFALQKQDSSTKYLKNDKTD